MNTFVSNFVDIFETKDINTEKEVSVVEQQLALAEKYIADKKKECAKYALLIVRQLWQEKKSKEIMQRYNNAVELFNAL